MNIYHGAAHRGVAVGAGGEQGIFFDAPGKQRCADIHKDAIAIYLIIRVVGKELTLVVKQFCYVVMGRMGRGQCLGNLKRAVF